MLLTEKDQMFTCAKKHRIMEEHYPAGALGWKGLIVLRSGSLHDLLPAGATKASSGRKGRYQRSSCRGCLRIKATWAQKWLCGTHSGERSAWSHVWEQEESEKVSQDGFLLGWISVKWPYSVVVVASLILSFFFFFFKKMKQMRWEVLLTHGRWSPGDGIFWCRRWCSFLSVLQLVHSKPHYAGFKTVGFFKLFFISVYVLENCENSS